jgi:heat shock protein HspQ
MNSKQKFNKGDLVEFEYSGLSGVIVQIDQGALASSWRRLLATNPPKEWIQYHVHLLDGRKRWTTGKNIKKVA